MAPVVDATARRDHEQMQVVRARILAKVTEKYPGKPMDFRERKVNKQMVTMCKQQPTEIISK